jgi:hypothetical protein
MHLAEAYRQLELDPGATDIELKRAHRELTKVWHPDRFAGDASLSQKAGQKLAAINEAYETILASRDSPREDPSSWRVRSRGREYPAPTLDAIVILVDDGAFGDEAEVFDPEVGAWSALTSIPILSAALARRRVRRNRNWALTCAILAILILLRRPVPGGVVAALVLFGVAFYFVMRMRS